MIKGKRWKMVAKQQAIMEDFDFDESALKPREIAVRTDFTAISPGTECANFLALDPNVLIPGKWCTYPWVPGYAGCGHVIAVGSEVKQYKIGDGVVGVLRHSTHGICNADNDVIPLDPQVNPQHATYLRLAGIAITSLMVLQPDTLPTVGVWGLGMIGNLVAQLMQRAGGRVIGIDPVAERRALAKKCGIPHTLDPTSPQFADSIRQLSGGLGLDIALDTTGLAPTTITITSFVRPRGQMVLMTHWRSQPTVDLTQFIFEIFNKGLTLQGAHETAPSKLPSVEAGAVHIRKLKKVQQALADGSLQIAPLISHVVKPSQFMEAYNGLCFERSKWWGVVVDWR